MINRLVQHSKAILRPIVHDIRDRLAPGPLILMYHRVGAEGHDPQLLSVSTGYFEEQMSFLARHYDVLPLEELDSRRKAGRLGAADIAITFDDGYADNVEVALPIVEQLRLPVTIFVSTGWIEKPAELYWDELAGLILTGAPSSDILLDLEVKGVRHQWLLPAAARPEAPGWSVEMPAVTPAQTAYSALCALLRQCSPAERDSLLDQIAAQLGGARMNRFSHKAMGKDQLKALAQNNLIEIGGHTVSHPSLMSLEPAEQRREIERNKEVLEAHLGRRITSFAYPYGKPGFDYDSGSMKIVEEAGYERACSVHVGRLTPSTNGFALPRLCVRDWPGKMFEKVLSRRLPSSTLRRAH